MPESRVHVFVSEPSKTSTFGTTPRNRPRSRRHRLVRNLDDGRVEAVFEGSEEAVETMVEWCRDGPIKADIKDVEIEEGDPQGDLDDFENR